MALGEQFESRTITHTREGSTGERIWLTTWPGQLGADVPKVGDPWPTDHVHGGAAEYLWVRSVTPRPYAASGDGAGKAATHAHIDIEYDSTRPIGVAQDDWKITTGATLMTVEVGTPRVFSLRDNNNQTVQVPDGQTLIQPAQEIIIRGLEMLAKIDAGALPGAFPEKLKAKYLVRPSDHAVRKLGRVCTEKWIAIGGFSAVENQLLFESEEFAEPFARREGKSVVWYREFTRRFLWRLLLTKNAANQHSHATHNTLWNPALDLWDHVIPPLYPEIEFGDLFPF